jgi:hypothetical protein
VYGVTGAVAHPTPAGSKKKGQTTKSPAPTPTTTKHYFVAYFAA